MTQRKFFWHTTEDVNLVLYCIDMLLCTCVLVIITAHVCSVPECSVYKFQSVGIVYMCEHNLSSDGCHT